MLDENAVIGTRFAEARKQRGWTLRDTERVTGVPSGHISQIETGKIRQPSPALIAKLAHAYGTDDLAPGRWEYGQLYSSGGFLTFNESPEVEAIYPLADRLKAGMKHGGHVYRRRITVISDWEEIGPDDVSA